jgi:hypothetical protein
MSHAKETLTRNTALQSEPVKPEITLGDEEVSDVSLATFHVVDRENVADGQRLSRISGGARRRFGSSLTATNKMKASIRHAAIASEEGPPPAIPTYSLSKRTGNGAQTRTHASFATLGTPRGTPSPRHPCRTVTPA